MLIDIEQNIAVKEFRKWFNKFQTALKNIKIILC